MITAAVMTAAALRPGARHADQEDQQCQENGGESDGGLPVGHESVGQENPNRRPIWNTANEAT
jgi:hypothetical protein